MKRDNAVTSVIIIIVVLISGKIFLNSQILIGSEDKKTTVPVSKNKSITAQNDVNAMMNEIKFVLCCSTEAIVTDPLGRRLGFDQNRNKRYSEIPHGGVGSPVRDSSPKELSDSSKEIIIGEAINGDYLISIIGTKIGKYRLDVRKHNTLRQSSAMILAKDVPISPNVVHSYSVHYDSTNLSATSASGGFDGGGQRPKDVNKFLTYANPSDSQTDLPAGTTTFPLMIFYGSNIIASTFKASLNGVDITSLFNPNPGSHETVTINLTAGRNVLSLSTDGNLPTRVATDTDRLVFIVK